jgi:hypothetical protein
MSFLQWYGIGIVILLMLFSLEAFKSNNTIKKAIDEVYDIFIRRADKLSTIVLLIVALFGPILIPAIGYFKFRSWQDGLAVDEDGNRDYPWSKE